MKVLIVGLGSIARKHIDALRVIDNQVEIFALRRKDSVFDSEEGINNIFEPIDNLDFIIVSNPTAEHSNAIRNLLYLDKPFFIEKPLFSSLNFDELIKNVSESGINTYVACNLRFLECISFVKECISEKRVNEVNIYCGSYLPEWRKGVDFRKVYSSIKELGGGVHIDLIHEIDYLVHLFGFPKKVNKFFKNNSSLNITAYDFANYLFEYNDFSASIVLNYYRRNPKRTLEILCEDGEYEVDLLANTVYWNNKLVFESEQQIKDTYLPQMNFFINNVINGDTINDFNNIHEAYQILKLCLED